MQVAGIEVGDAFQAFVIENGHATVAQGNHLPSPQLLQNAVGVYGADANGVPQIVLRDREREVVAGYLVDGLQTMKHLAKEMRHAGDGAAQTHMCCPPAPCR